MNEPGPEQEGDHRFQVFGLNVVVRMLSDPPNEKIVHCPKGGNILYGQVVAAGDGYDPQANAFRPMPAEGALVSFEEGMETVEGHYFYFPDGEYRVLHVECLIVAFPEE